MPETTTELLFRPDPMTLGFLPEGPQRLGPGLFSWIGIQHGADATVGSLNRFDLASGAAENWSLSGRPGFAIPTSTENRFLVGMERRLIYFDSTGQEEIVMEGIDEDVAGTIINDGLATANGCLFGSKELTFSDPKAGLYWWPFGASEAKRLRSDQICSNGKVLLAETEDEIRFLDIDTPTQSVREYLIETHSGKILEEKIALDVSDQPGFPDGMVGTPDGEGVIIALFNPHDAGPGRAKWFDLKTGAEKHCWLTPDSPQVTCPLLIDHAGSIHLVLTTAAENMDESRLAGCPNAGGLFIGETTFESLPDVPLAR